MMATPLLGLPLLAAAQAQKHVTHNDALIALDYLVQIAVIGVAAQPPASPLAGDAYLVDVPASGAFAGNSGTLAQFDGATWRFHPPKVGWVLYNQADGYLNVFTGGGWIKIVDQVRAALASLQNLTGLGIGTAPDATNRIAVKSNAALFTALAVGEGGSGDLRFTLNKEAAANTASQLYQTGYSGRAETGLLGDDKFHVKLSPDGLTWREAILADPATGSVRMDLILSGRGTQANGGRIECDFNGVSASGAVLTDTSAAATATILSVRKSNAQVGAIKATATGTNYATTSDYRLKQDVAPLADGLSRVLALKPRSFAFRAAPDHRVDGFIAHELAEIVPDAVNGTKDAVLSDGTPDYQSVDFARLVPLLVAALQDLAVRLATIEAKR